jgi:hypothetical protein
MITEPDLSLSDLITKHPQTFRHYWEIKLQKYSQPLQSSEEFEFISKNRSCGTWKRNKGRAMSFEISPLVFQYGLPITTITYPFLFAIYYRRRHRFPIQQRLPNIVLFEVISLVFVSLIESLLGALPTDTPILTNCKINLIAVTVLMSISELTIAYRICWLFIKDFTTKIAMKTEGMRANSIDQQIATSRRKNFAFQFTENAIEFQLRYFSVNQIPLNYIGIPILIALIDLTFLMINAESGNQSIWMSPHRCSGFLLSVSLKLSSLAYLLILGSVAIGSLLQIRDNFQIGTEVRAICIPLSIVVGVVAALPSQESWRFLFIETKLFNFLIGLVSVPALIYIQLLYPIYLSFKHDRDKPSYRLKVQKKNAGSLENSLSSASATKALKCKSIGELGEELIETLETGGRQALLDFLETEFATENLLFYEDCQRFAELCKQEGSLSPKVKEEAEKIMRVYISTSSLSAVNISHKIRSNLMEVRNELNNQDLRHLKPDLFEDAKVEIFLLLVRDSYQRFKCHPTYKKLAEKSLSTL